MKLLAGREIPHLLYNPKDSLSCLQEPTADPYPDKHKFISHHSTLFPSDKYYCYHHIYTYLLQVVPSFPAFPVKLCIEFSFFLFMLHGQ